ncbi:MAG: protocatechuate 3,4-dioxygenase subunit alpha [Acidobacteriia bacterium]|nr:protocatechuate 3,4-dioxygenase subunit alpha [Terriglobia bacterium]
MSQVVASPYGTVGPFFPFAFVDDCNDLTEFQGRKARGQHIWLAGRVVEEGGVPTANTVLEFWQPDGAGVFRHPLDPRYSEVDPGFHGWGRARTDGNGLYKIRTVLPGQSREEDGTLRCPHVVVSVLAIGLTRRLVTTLFFSETPEAVTDPVLACVPDAKTRRRLFAARDPILDAEGLPGYRFDIVLRGDNETPFFLD